MMEYYIAHHGVKGMKWGVRKNTGFRRLLRGKRRFDFTYNTKRGEQIASTRASRRQIRNMKKNGYLDRRGNVVEGYEAKARNYLVSRNILKISFAVAASAALIARGKGFIGK